MMNKMFRIIKEVIHILYEKEKNVKIQVNQIGMNNRE